MIKNFWEDSKRIFVTYAITEIAMQAFISDLIGLEINVSREGLA